MNYELTKIEPGDDSTKIKTSSIKELVRGEYSQFLLALAVILLNSAFTIAAPLLLGKVVDVVTKNPDLGKITTYSLYLLGIYAIVAITNYYQTMLTGRMGQRVLFRLRNEIFAKLQSFPIAFFNANKSGDLISRINNDTEKLNQFFSEGLVRLTSQVFTIAGIGIFIVILNWKLGLVTLSAGIVLFILSSILGPWIRSRNKRNLEAVGNFAADIQENLNNYKVLVVFNRKDYFRKKMHDSTKRTYDAAFRSGIANTISAPLYDLASKVSYLLVLIFGIYLITQGEITLGILVTFIAYADSFYMPLRELASVYSMVQSGLAAWSRIQEILSLKSNKVEITEPEVSDTHNIMEFKNVDFSYTNDKLILSDVTFQFEEGKTYALVGPTGGGKSTTAALMSRLYDPIEGKVFLHGKDIRSFSDEERAETIGFILQEPFIFTGTIYENLLYGNKKYTNMSKEDFVDLLESKELHEFISRFPQGIETPISSSEENISLGQKQVIAFLRTLLREPRFLILDEATANIDTITEESLQKIIDRLPKETTKVIIAHRLNTIDKADEIIFINAGMVQKAQSFDETVELIQQSKRVS
jgi:ATP-binding cassette, subfamily B, bacterial